MKTKVTIENGEVEISLTPENNFEKRVIEDIRDDRYNEKRIVARHDNRPFDKTGHVIEITLKKIDPPNVG